MYNFLRRFDSTIAIKARVVQLQITQPHQASHTLPLEYLHRTYGIYRSS